MKITITTTSKGFSYTEVEEARVQEGEYLCYYTVPIHSVDDLMTALKESFRDHISKLEERNTHGKE